MEGHLNQPGRGEEGGGGRRGEERGRGGGERGEEIRGGGGGRRRGRVCMRSNIEMYGESYAYYKYPVTSQDIT